MCRQISCVATLPSTTSLLTLPTATEQSSKAANTTCRRTLPRLQTASRRSAASQPSILPPAVRPAATVYVLAISHAFDARMARSHPPDDRSTAPTSSAPPRSPRASAPNVWAVLSTSNAQEPKKKTEEEKEKSSNNCCYRQSQSRARTCSSARPPVRPCPVHSRRTQRTLSLARALSISSVSAPARTEVQQPAPNILIPLTFLVARVPLTARKHFAFSSSISSPASTSPHTFTLRSSPSLLPPSSFLPPSSLPPSLTTVRVYSISFPLLPYSRSTLVPSLNVQQPTNDQTWSTCVFSTLPFVVPRALRLEQHRLVVALISRCSSALPFRVPCKINSAVSTCSAPLRLFVRKI
jgi:hypothetical protein